MTPSHHRGSSFPTSPGPAPAPTAVPAFLSSAAPIPSPPRHRLRRDAFSSPNPPCCSGAHPRLPSRRPVDLEPRFHVSYYMDLKQEKMTIWSPVSMSLITWI